MATQFDSMAQSKYFLISYIFRFKCYLEKLLRIGHDPKNRLSSSFSHDFAKYMNSFDGKLSKYANIDKINAKNASLKKATSISHICTFEYLCH